MLKLHRCLAGHSHINESGRYLCNKACTYLETATKAELRAARNWIKGCADEVDSDHTLIDSASDHEIVVWMLKNYQTGWESFVKAIKEKELLYVKGARNAIANF